jgi:NAD-dependent dihydropyrimidine dehydrogenase PreA subunit
VRKPTPPERKRVYNYRYRYGITVEEYDAMLAAQDGKCRICHQPPERGRLHIDHDHDTGAVRELLCIDCNRKIAAMEDPVWFAVATDYLNRHHPKERTLVD